MPLFVNADWSALVPEGSPEARFGITEKDAKRRGLLPLAPGEQFEQPEVLYSANEPEPTPEPAPDPEPETEAKELPKPNDKAAAKPRTK